MTRTGKSWSLFSEETFWNIKKFLKFAFQFTFMWFLVLLAHRVGYAIISPNFTQEKSLVEWCSPVIWFVFSLSSTTFDICEVVSQFCHNPLWCTLHNNKNIQSCFFKLNPYWPPCKLSKIWMDETVCKLMGDFNTIVKHCCYLNLEPKDQTTK